MAATVGLQPSRHIQRGESIEARQPLPGNVDRRGSCLLQAGANLIEVGHHQCFSLQRPHSILGAAFVRERVRAEELDEIERGQRRESTRQVAVSVNERTIFSAKISLLSPKATSRTMPSPPWPRCRFQWIRSSLRGKRRSFGERRSAQWQGGSPSMGSFERNGGSCMFSSVSRQLMEDCEKPKMGYWEAAGGSMSHKAD